MAHPMPRLDSTDFQHFLEQTGELTDGEKAKMLFAPTGSLAPLKTEPGTGPSRSSKDSELRADFTFRGGFQASYQRNNKKGGKKHLRCFPCCGAEHKASRACQVPMNVHCKLKRTTTKVPVSTLASYVAVARFVVADELERDTMVIGQDLPASQLARLTRSAKEPLLPLYRAHVSAVKDRQLDFEFLEKGWHYGWRSARYKEQVYHHMVVYIFRPASADFEWAEDVAGDDDPENIAAHVRGNLKCIQKIISPRFSLYSSRSVNGKAAAAAKACSGGASCSTGDPKSPDSGIFTDNGDSARNSVELTKSKSKRGRKSAVGGGGNSSSSRSKSKSKRGGGKRKANNTLEDGNEGGPGWSSPCGDQSEEAAMFARGQSELDFNFNASDKALLDFDETFSPRAGNSNRHGGGKHNKGGKKGRNDKGKRVRVEEHIDEFRPLEPGEASPNSDFDDFQMLVWPFMTPAVHGAMANDTDKNTSAPSIEQISEYSSESEESSETDSQDIKEEEEEETEEESQDEDESGSQTDTTDGEEFDNSTRSSPSKPAAVQPLRSSSPWSKNKNKGEVPTEVAEQANEAAEKLRSKRSTNSAEMSNGGPTGNHHPLSQYADGSRAVPRSGNSDGVDELSQHNNRGSGSNRSSGIEVELAPAGNHSEHNSLHRGDSTGIMIPTAIVVEQEHTWEVKQRKKKARRILYVLGIIDVLLIIALIILNALAAQKNPGDDAELGEGVPFRCLAADAQSDEEGVRRLLMIAGNELISPFAGVLLEPSPTTESQMASRTTESEVVPNLNRYPSFRTTEPARVVAVRKLDEQELVRQFEEYVMEIYDDVSRNKAEDLTVLFKKSDESLMLAFINEVAWAAVEPRKKYGGVRSMSMETLFAILDLFSKTIVTVPTSDCQTRVVRSATDLLDYQDERKEYDRLIGMVGPVAGVTVALLGITAAVAVWGSSRFRPSSTAPKEDDASTTDLCCQL